MPINNFFNGKRFLALFQHDFSINKKTYFWTLIASAIILYGVNFFFLFSFKWQTEGYFIRVHRSYFLWTIPILIYFTGTAFSEFRNGITTQNFLLLPASIFEKFLVQFAVRFLMFFPVILILFWSTSKLAKASLFSENKEWQVKSSNYDNLIFNNQNSDIINHAYNTEAEINYQSSRVPDFDLGTIWHPKTIDSGLVVILCVAFVSLFVVFAGTVYFKRFGLVKSLVLIVLLSVSWMLAIHFYDQYLITKMGQKEWLNAGQYYFINMVLRNSVLFVIWVSLTITLLLGFTYYKLKEKEA